jgi:sentrin-specific protease 1
MATSDAIQVSERVFALARQWPDTVFTTTPATPLTGESLLRLSDGQWLNDELVNGYLSLLVAHWPHCYALSSFWLPMISGKHHGGQYDYGLVQNWTREVNLLGMDKVLVPVHSAGHWSLAVMNIRSTSLEYYDSLGSSNTSSITVLRRFLKDFVMDRLICWPEDVLPVEHWPVHEVMNIPQQTNGFDCGVYVCQFAACVASEQSLSFSQVDVSQFRRVMVIELMKGTLL